MARIGNWDVTLNKQGWFDISAADPLNGWFDKTAVGVEGITIAPPGIPSAAATALPKIFQIISAPGIPSAQGQAPALVAALIEPPGIPSPAVEGPPELAIAIRPAGIPSAERVQPGDATSGIRPPGIPSAAPLVEADPGRLAAGIAPPGIPAAEVEAPANVAPPPPPAVPRHGGYPWRRFPPPPPPPELPRWWTSGWDDWNRDNRWQSWLESQAANERSETEEVIPASSFDSNDDNIYFIPSHRFRSSPRAVERDKTLAYLSRDSLERAAGLDLDMQRKETLRRYLWVGAAVLAGIAIGVWATSAHDRHDRHRRHRLRRRHQ